MQCKFNYMEATQSVSVYYMVVFQCVLSTTHSLNCVDEKTWTEYT